MTRGSIIFISLFLIVTALTGQQSTGLQSSDSIYRGLVMSARQAQHNMERDKLDSLADQILQLAVDRGNNDYHHYGLFFKSEALIRTRPKEVIPMAEKALAYFEKVDDHSKCSRISNSLGHGYSNIGDTETAIEYYNLAVEHSNKRKNADSANEVRFRTSILYNIAFALMRKGELDRSAEHLYRALDIAEPTNDTVILSSIYFQIGNLQVSREQPNDALKYYKRALNISGDQYPSLTTVAMTGIGGVYQELGRLDSALYYSEQVLPVIRKSNNVFSLCGGLYNLAELYNLMGDYDSAIMHAQELIGHAESGGFLSFEVSGGYVLARAYQAKENYNLAKRATNRPLALVDSISDFHISSELYLLMSELSEEKDQYRQALHYQKLHKQYSDSLLNVNSLNKIDELVITHETKEKEARIMQLESEKSLEALAFRQKITLGLSVFVIFGLVALLYISWINKRRIVSKRQKESIEQRLLRSQMNPHFIFNAISSIQNYLFEKSDLKIALNYLSKFSALMRQILENTREEFILLEEEVSSLENYLELQQLRYSNSFGYEIIVDEDIDLQGLKVPPLIAQPFVENAIEHGMIYRIEHGLVRIRFSNLKTGIVLSIEDNGVGPKSVKITPKYVDYKKKSLASVITRERLELLSKHSRNKFDMVVSSLKEGGTLVTIQLPKILAA